MVGGGDVLEGVALAALDACVEAFVALGCGV